MVLGPAEKTAQEYLRNRSRIDEEIELFRQLLAEDHKKQLHRSKILQYDLTQLPAYKKLVQAEKTRIEKLQAERDKALFLIGQIEDDRLKTVLQLSYIDNMTAEAAAEQMHYSTHHFFRLRAEALHAAARLLEQLDL